MKWTVAIWTLWLTTAAWGQAGCTYPSACNFDSSAVEEDGSCLFPPEHCSLYGLVGGGGCTYPDGDNYDPDATWDDGSCTLFQYTNPCPGDFNFDSWIATSDLLLFLGVFGEGC